MANLKDLEDFATGIVPVVKDLFSQATGGAAAPDPGPAAQAIQKLTKLVSEASLPTAANNIQAAEAVTTVRGTLLSVLTEAAASTTALAPTDANTITVLFTALENRAGQLLVQAAFAGIPALISPSDLQRIQATVQAAEREIRARQQAKQALDAVVKTVIVAAQIASKIAV